MANTIILKRSATPGKVPTTAQLSLGEIAINTYDGLLYIKKDDGTPSVVQIGGVTSVNGETGAVTIDTGDVAENGNLYFTNARARSALSAGTGISYNSSTGAISTTQNLSTAGSPTFAGLTLTGSVGITGSIIPSADITYDLGSPSYQWKDIYVGPGSLYVNGSKVLQDDTGTITFSADADQNIRIKTTGNGILQLGSSTTLLQVDSTLQITSGKNITDSAGVEVNFGDNIDMNNNKIVGLGAPSANTDAATKGYVDTQVAAISTSSITQGNSNVTVTDTGTGTVTVSVDGSTALTVTSSGVTVAGNLTVSGTTTTVESNTVSLADNILTLNSDATGAPTQNAGIEVERGDEANVQVRWNEGSDKWTFTNDGAVYHPMAVSTDDLAEGSTNQYHTTARARGAISASSATGVSYNSTTGAISLGGIPNSSLSNSSITINGTAVSLGGTRTLDSDAISEGSTNLYHTTARARGAVSAGTGISYNSTTGVISTSAIPNASLTNSKVTVGSTDISLGGSATTIAGLTSVTSTAFVGALTGNADTATSAGKWTTARTITLGGDLTGSVSIDGSAGVTLTATIAANSVALGTDTTGNYMSDVTAGTGISVSHTAGEGSTATISIDTATTVDKTTAQTLTNKTFSDSTTYFVDETNDTKKLQFQLSGISANFTRTLTVPDESGTIATQSWVTTQVQSKDNTDEITEGSTNLYFTNARARAAVSFTAGSGAYNSSTGVITIPTNTNQLTNGAGFITGYTETDTLATVTGRGATTSAALSTGALTVTGAITATGEVTAYYSDKRLKENIKPIGNALAKTLSLHGVTYNANDVAASFGYTNKETQVGLLAQDVQAVLPEVIAPAPFDVKVVDGKEVSKSGEDYITVKYEKIVALLVEAIKELNDKVESLEAQLGGSKSL